MNKTERMKRDMLRDKLIHETGRYTCEQRTEIIISAKFIEMMMQVVEKKTDGVDERVSETINNLIN